MHFGNKNQEEIRMGRKKRVEQEVDEGANQAPVKACGTCARPTPREQGGFDCELQDEPMGSADRCELYWEPGEPDPMGSEAEPEDDPFAEGALNLGDGEAVEPKEAGSEETTTEPDDEPHPKDPEETTGKKVVTADKVIKKAKMYLRYDFTREEKEEMALELAEQLSVLVRRQDNKKRVMKSLDSDIAETNLSISKLGRLVKDGYEHRNILCEVLFDYPNREKVFTRLDTQEVVKRSTMSPEELQRVFEFVEA
jgi:hypothetical protein